MTPRPTGSGPYPTGPSVTGKRPVFELYLFSDSVAYPRGRALASRHRSGRPVAQVAGSAVHSPVGWLVAPRPSLPGLASGWAGVSGRSAACGPPPLAMPWRIVVVARRAGSAVEHLQAYPPSPSHVLGLEYAFVAVAEGRVVAHAEPTGGLGERQALRFSHVPPRSRASDCSVEEECEADEQKDAGHDGRTASSAHRRFSCPEPDRAEPPGLRRSRTEVHVLVNIRKFTSMAIRDMHELVNRGGSQVEVPAGGVVAELAVFDVAAHGAGGAVSGGGHDDPFGGSAPGCAGGVPSAEAVAGEVGGGGDRGGPCGP